MNFFKNVQNGVNWIGNKLKGASHFVGNKLAPIGHKIGSIGQAIGAGVSFFNPAIGATIAGASTALKEGSKYIRDGSKYISDGVDNAGKYFNQKKNDGIQKMKNKVKQNLNFS